jgi:hypothetical protein
MMVRRPTAPCQKGPADGRLLLAGASWSPAIANRVCEVSYDKLTASSLDPLDALERATMQASQEEEGVTPRRSGSY